MASSAPPGKARLYMSLSQPAAGGHQGAKSAGVRLARGEEKGYGVSGDTTVWIQGKEKDEDLLWRGENSRKGYVQP